MENNTRDTMIVYRSFYEAIKELSFEDQGRVWNAVFEYGLNFNELELSGISKTIFKLMKPNIEANIKRYRNGSKAKSEQEASENEASGKQNGSKTEAKEDQSVSKVEANKDKDKDENKDKEISSISERVIFELNLVSGSSYRHNSGKTLSAIRARVNEGWTVEDLIAVVFDRAAAWKNDPKMSDYLRPETLFGSKFESYLQAAKKKISSDPATKYEILKNKGFENCSKEEIEWVYDYQYRTDYSFSQYPADELLLSRGYAITKAQNV